jgi:cyclophilin family peptidyl-prolyl cis-trans isomerase
MPNRRTRDRQLSKLAARRAAERKRKHRQRQLALGIGSALLVGLLILLFFLFDPGKKASTLPTSSPTPTASASSSPGTVACGGKVPKAAGVKKPQFQTTPPQSVLASKTYTATMVTSCGTITIELLPKVAPVTVNSFVFLARHHFFDGLIFHRIATNPPVIQGGDPTGTGSGGPGYQFKDELDNTLTYTAGTLAMANAGPNTNGSQFFIMTGADANLPHNYTIFGKVVKGMDVVQTISQVPVGGTSGETPTETIYIQSVTIKVS